MEYKKNCLLCKKEFIAFRKDKKYCKKSCVVKHNIIINPTYNMSQLLYRKKYKQTEKSKLLTKKYKQTEKSKLLTKKYNKDKKIKFTQYLYRGNCPKDNLNCGFSIRVEYNINTKNLSFSSTNVVHWDRINKKFYSHYLDNQQHLNIIKNLDKEILNKINIKIKSKLLNMDLGDLETYG